MVRQRWMGAGGCVLADVHGNVCKAWQCYFGRKCETCNAAELATLVEVLKFLLEYDQVEG